MKPLEVVNLSKNFGGLEALGRISFSVLPGEILGIIGPNGAGKTTLFNCISGFLSFDSGSVILFGRSIEGHKPYQVVNLGLTRTWQLLKPFFGMRVMEAMMVPSLCRRARTKHHSKKEKQEKIMQILEDMGLGEKVWQEVDNLNQGELRLLDIARALGTFPKILLLDEPFSGLSHREIENISHVVGNLNAQGLPVVIIEHRLRELMRLVQKVVVINFGRKIAEGTPKVIVRDPIVIKAYLGERRPKIGLA